MEKTLTIDNKDIKFKANALLPYVYKAQFHKDLFITLFPFLDDVLGAISAYKDGDDLKTFITANLSEILSGVEITDITDIIWAMAKTADETIDNPESFYAQFDDFSVFDVAFDLKDVFLQSFLSKKKLQTFKTTVSTAQL